MTTEAAGGAIRQAGFAEADEAAQFGRMWNAFCEARNQARRLMIEGVIESGEEADYCIDEFEACFYWAFPSVIGDDKQFLAFYKDFQGKTMSTSDMVRVLGYVKAALRRTGFWVFKEPATFKAFPPRNGHGPSDHEEPVSAPGETEGS
jgi:hypothetical protein